jgi:dihydroneopterin aldolase
MSVGVDMLKLAIDARAIDELELALGALARQVDLVGLLWADRTPELDLLARLAAIGFKGAVFDTAEKGSKRLLDYKTPAELEQFCERCRELGLTSGLAGSLEPPDVPRALLVGPTVLGFRRALCADLRRDGPVDARAVARIRSLIPAGDDRRRKTATRKVQDPVQLSESDLDAVFIRDFLATADLGAYRREHGAPQRVMFNVEAWVARSESRADDMRNIFSYDVILDAIRLVIGRGHANVIETIAEQVAQIVLRHPRVRRIRIRVEKLDVIPGGVGIEIVRERVSGEPE